MKNEIDNNIMNDQHKPHAGDNDVSIINKGLQSIKYANLSIFTSFQVTESYV